MQVLPATEGGGGGEPGRVGVSVTPLRPPPGTSSHVRWLAGCSSPFQLAKCAGESEATLVE